MVVQGNLVTGLLAGFFLVLIHPAFAIDVKLTTEEAQRALEAGRASAAGDGVTDSNDIPGLSVAGSIRCMFVV